jgi:hypothetical protein
MPMLLVDQIISVQPMPNPTGQIHIIKYKFRPTNKEILFKDREIIETDMKILHTTLRPFMPPGYPEPNEHYRPWLEKNVGAQGIDWQWGIYDHDIDLIEIHFANREHATLFELMWK